VELQPAVRLKPSARTAQAAYVASKDLLDSGAWLQPVAARASPAGPEERRALTR